MPNAEVQRRMDRLQEYVDMLGHRQFRDPVLNRAYDGRLPMWSIADLIRMEIIWDEATNPPVPQGFVWNELS